MNLRNNLTAVVYLEANPLVEECFKLLLVGNRLGHGSNALNLKIKLINFDTFLILTVQHCNRPSRGLSSQYFVQISAQNLSKILNV